MAVKERNQTVDIIRGIAMLLVVLGHTMTGCTTGPEKTFLYNIVWTLQIPLFILISGYVTRYGKELVNRKDLLNYLKKRSIAYLLPWLIWSIFIRGLIFGQTSFLSIKWLLWHADSGYWFLLTIWTISVVFGLASFFGNKVIKEASFKQQAVILAFYILGMTVLAGIGLLAGMSFIAIKLTLYYMPFYFAGYLYGQYQEVILNIKWGKSIIDIIVAACLAAWLLIITKYHIFLLPDKGTSILLRVLASVSGCIAVCGLIVGLFAEFKGIVKDLLCWCGKYSLGIYLSHYLLLSLLKATEVPLTGSIQGIVLILGNYLTTIILTVLVVKIINSNKTLSLILFGNKFA